MTPPPSQPKRAYHASGLYAARRAVEAFGARALPAPSTPLGAALEEWRASLVADLGGDPSTAQRAIIDLAVRTRRLTTRPHIEMLDESDNARQGFLEPEDFEALRAHLPADVADAARFAYHSAWRRGEVLGLEWRDVTLERREGAIIGGTIRLPAARSKNRRGRVLVLRADLLDVLRDRYARRRLDCPLVFHRTGRPIRDFRESWDGACRKAGLGGVLFHDLRRSAVRNLVRAGVSWTVAMAISGHKTASVFRRYDITNEADIAAALDLTAADVARKRERARKIDPLAENADNSRTLSA